MPRAVVALLALFIPTLLLAGEGLFPLPDEMRDDVAFWRRIYTEFDTRSGVVHDSWRLDIVYEPVRFDATARTRSARERLVRQVKARYQRALLNLAAGKRENLDSAEQRALALWGENVDAQTLRTAAGQLRFQLGQADKFRAGLERSGRWLAFIRESLKDMGLPQELAVLPHVESSFHPGALSKVGATGLWQFTRSTGRRFMRIDHVIDERLDPWLATTAALRLLKYNHDTLGHWPLALTAYNHGLAGMRRAVRQVGSQDIAVIARRYRSRSFGFASRNFYPAFLAALEVDRKAGSFFPGVRREPAADLATLNMPAFVAADRLAAALGIDIATLRAHNPALLAPVWSGDKYIPRGFGLRLPRQLLVGSGTRALAALTAPDRHAAQVPDREHVVSSGDTLSAIAAYYGSSVAELASLNGLRDRHSLRIGQVLILPGGAAARPAVAAAGADAGVSDVAEVAEVAEAEAASAPGTTLEVSAVGSVAAPPPVPADTAADVLADEGEGTLNEAQPMLAADPTDYTVDTEGRIVVQVLETLGHYADWLAIPTQRLRDLNGLRFGHSIELGDRLRLDFSEVPAGRFEARREAFHRDVQATFFAAHRIHGMHEHVVQRGDSLWLLLRSRYRVPFWLLRQYNPDLDPARLSPGMVLRIPQVVPVADGLSPG